MTYFDQEIAARLSRIERLLELLLRAIVEEEVLAVATQQTIDQLTAGVRANTDAANSAAAALNGFVATVADLTKQLQDAIAAGDEAAVKAAADAIDANNKVLSAAVPAVSQAVPANTPAAPAP